MDGRLANHVANLVEHLFVLFLSRIYHMIDYFSQLVRGRRFRQLTGISTIVNG